MLRLWEKKFRSDAEVHMDKRVWKVHTAILGVPGRNKYFERAFKKRPQKRPQVSTKARFFVQRLCKLTILQAGTTGTVSTGEAMLDEEVEEVCEVGFKVSTKL